MWCRCDQSSRESGKSETAESTAAELEARRKHILSALNNSGVYNAMKERLKRSVVRGRAIGPLLHLFPLVLAVAARDRRSRDRRVIVGCAGALQVRVVRERFNKTELQTDEEFQTAKDLFISELYTYLMGQAHRAMHDAFVEVRVSSVGVDASEAATVVATCRCLRGDEVARLA